MSVWFLSFDGHDNPIAPTAAAMVATKLFWALGYNQVETYLTTVRPENIVIGETATVREHGKRRRADERRRRRCARAVGGSADGSYRAVAGRAVSGRPLGGFSYPGTRPDDPTTSSRTSIGASCARCRCSARGPTSST